MTEKNDTEVNTIAELASQRAMNLYDTQKLCCSESVIAVLNQVFHGGLTPEMAVRMGSGFCEGLGGAGCVCGALSGAVVALNVILGPDQPGGIRKGKFRKAVRRMHDLFKERNRATCCRVLTKKVRHDRKLHRENCKRLTGTGAELAVQVILENRPDLAREVDLEFLGDADSKLGGLFKRMRGKKGQ